MKTRGPVGILVLLRLNKVAYTTKNPQVSGMSNLRP
ncbi:unnamed protein product [Rhodiola kirilowii]